MTVVIDNIYKFVTTKTCLERIEEIMSNHDLKKAEKERLISEEFTHKSVIGTWGQNKAYIIQKVIFDKNPKTMFFTNRFGDNLNIVEYFLQIYTKKIKALD